MLHHTTIKTSIIVFENMIILCSIYLEELCELIYVFWSIQLIKIFQFLFILVMLH